MSKNSLVIEIQDGAPVRTQSGVSQKGKPYSIRKQEGWLHTGTDPYPQKISFPLEDGASAFAPGLYEIHLGRSVIVNRYGELQFGRLMLVPARPLNEKAA